MLSDHDSTEKNVITIFECLAMLKVGMRRLFPMKIFLSKHLATYLTVNFSRHGICTGNKEKHWNFHSRSFPAKTNKN